MDFSTVSTIATTLGVSGLSLTMWWLARKDLKDAEGRHRAEREADRAKIDALTRDLANTIANNTAVFGTIASILQPKRRG
jgi:hypothetical protein